MNYVLSEYYRNQAKKLILSDTHHQEGEIFWRSPSNIALIKYWGKKDLQIPTNPSLSFSLSNSYTDTKIKFQTNNVTEKQSIEFFFNNQKQQEFERRICNFFEIIEKFEPFLKKLKLTVYSTNSFPHSAGIASSASAMSSIALGICSIENKLFGTLHSPADFYKKASFLARLGSGSACRSIHNGYNLWGYCDVIENSSDEIAIPINHLVNDIFFNLRDTILIISKKKKKISSSLGHNLMQNHIFAEARYNKAFTNLYNLLSALRSGDLISFSEIVRNEALMLHSLMMSSEPPFILMQPQTLSIIDSIENFCIDTKIPITYTLDAGPNIHLIYHNNYHRQVLDFIQNSIFNTINQENIIFDQLGGGCQLLSEK